MTNNRYNTLRGIALPLGSTPNSCSWPYLYEGVVNAIVSGRYTYDLLNNLIANLSSIYDEKELEILYFGPYDRDGVTYVSNTYNLKPVITQVTERLKLLYELGFTNLEELHTRLLMEYAQYTNQMVATTFDDDDWFKTNVLDVYGDISRKLIIVEGMGPKYDRKLNEQLTTISKIGRAAGFHVLVASPFTHEVLSSDCAMNFAGRILTQCSKGASLKLCKSNIAVTLSEVPLQCVYYVTDWNKWEVWEVTKQEGNS